MARGYREVGREDYRARHVSALPHHPMVSFMLVREYHLTKIQPKIGTHPTQNPSTPASPLFATSTTCRRWVVWRTARWCSRTRCSTTWTWRRWTWCSSPRSPAPRSSTTASAIRTRTRSTSSSCSRVPRCLVATRARRTTLLPTRICRRLGSTGEARVSL